MPASTWRPAQPFPIAGRSKKKTKASNCRRPAIRLERIEDGIAAFYARFQVSEERIKQIRFTVLAEMAAQRADAE